MTLTEFLLARIAEDEAVARRCNTGPPIVLALQVGMDHHEGVESGWVEVDAGRVLAECEAKRAIVASGPSECGMYADQFEGGSTHYPDPDYFGYCEGCAAAEAADNVWRLALTALAAVYAGHPDFQEEWRA